MHYKRADIYRAHIIRIFFIAVLGVFVYANSLKGGFLWDDRFLAQDNPLIKEWRNLPDLFSNPLTPDFYSFYRPMANFSLMCDYHLWGLNPFGYHLTNVIIHIVNACLVYILICLVSRDIKISFSCGLVFSVHTVLTEPVNYISSRADLLMAFFFLISFVFYIGSEETRAGKKRYIFYIVSLLGFLAGLLSKEGAIMLPVILIIYEFVFKKVRFNRYIPFFLIVIIYGILRSTVLKFKSPGLYIPKHTIADLPFSIRFFTSITTIPVYLRLLIFPFGLHKAWLVRPIESIFQGKVLLSEAIIIGIFLPIKRYKQLFAFSVLWFFLLLSPHLNIIPLNAFMSEAWLYLPSLGFIIFLILILRIPILSRSRYVFNFILSLILIYYSISTVNRNKIWAGSAEIFYRDILRYNPNEDRIHNELGNLYFNEGRLDEAFSEYEKARLLNPSNGDIYYNLGNFYHKKRQLDMAILEFKKSLEFAPNYAEAHNNLGLVYFEQERLDLAELEFKRSIELDPNSFEPYFNLGNLYFKKKDFPSAIAEYKIAQELKPYYSDIYNNLGMVYFQLGSYLEAESAYKKAISIRPEIARYHNNLGNVYSTIHRLEDAIAEFKKAIAFDANYAEAYNDLGSAYFEMKDYSKAIVEYKKALSLNPEYAVIYYNLGVIYYIQGIYEGSRGHLRSAVELFNKQNNKDLEKAARELIQKIETEKR